MLNVLISVSCGYLLKAESMLFSLRRYTNEEITVYLMNHGLSREDIAGARRYLEQKCRMKLELLDVSNTALDSLPLGKLHFSIEMYYRLIAQFLLPKDLDRILWLDADIILLNDISEFYHQDFENKKYVVCPDAKADSKWVGEVKEKMKLPKEHIYFNSGVMLMNLEALRNDTDEKHIVDQCYELQDRLTYPDQDILNYLYQNDIKYADWKKYNYQLIGIDRIEKDDLKQIVVLHYCGGNKPWNYWQLNSASKYYWKVRVQQGCWREALQVYWRRMKETTKIYLCELKDLLF